jgi:hypothetical protein
MVGTLRSCAEEIEDIWFDWEFGIRTIVTAGDRALPVISCGIPYAPTKVRRLKRILSELRVNHGEFIFLDVGSGKGRALLVASEFPFRRIIGVEVLPELHFTAEKNIRAYRSTTQKCRVIELHCCDATDYRLSTENTVLFLSNPFEAPMVSRLLTNLRESLQSHPRQVYLVYHNPVCHELIVESDLFDVVLATSLYAVYKNRMLPRESAALNPGRPTPAGATGTGAPQDTRM